MIDIPEISAELITAPQDLRTSAASTRLYSSGDVRISPQNATPDVMSAIWAHEFERGVSHKTRNSLRGSDGINAIPSDLLRWHRSLAPRGESAAALLRSELPTAQETSQCGACPRPRKPRHGRAVACRRQRDLRERQEAAYIVSRQRHAQHTVASHKCGQNNTQPPPHNPNA